MLRIYKKYTFNYSKTSKSMDKSRRNHGHLCWLSGCYFLEMISIK
eukprot:UN22182